MQKESRARLMDWVTSLVSGPWFFVSLVFLVALVLYALYFSPYSLHQQQQLQEEIAVLTTKLAEKKQTLAAAQEKKLVRQALSLVKQDYVRENELLVDLKLPKLEKTTGEEKGHVNREGKKTEEGFLSSALKKPFFLSAFFFLSGLLFFLRKYR